MIIKPTFLFFTILLLITFCLNSYAQGTTEFEINKPEHATANAKYGKFRFIDQRSGLMYMGFVQTGAFNKRSLVVEKDPMEMQLTNAFNILADRSRNEELLFQLRYCSFSEQSSSFSEHGYFALRASFYGKRGGTYQPVLRIDTIMKISAMDVTNKLLKTASETFTTLIDSALKRDPAGEAYTINDIIKIDSIEKKGLAAYQAKILSDGVYLSAQSFFKQQPDASITSAKINEKNIVAYTTTREGKEKKVKASDCYAIVYQGKPYVSYLQNFYYLNKENNDFTVGANFPIGVEPYTGTSVSSTNYGMMGGMNGGAIGGLIGATADVAMRPAQKGGLTAKLDHITGKLMIVY